MRWILPFAIGSGLLIWAFRRLNRLLNRLVFDVQIQRAQIEKLQAQIETLHAISDDQGARLEAMIARMEASEAAILAGTRARIALWQQNLTDLDSRN